MIIAIANDHHGIDVKKKVIDYLKNNNIDYINLGVDENESVDYTQYALKLCDEIKKENANLGILICGTGIGMIIIANKIDGIYCAKVNDVREAELARVHNGVNVIAIGKNAFNVDKIVNAFIKSVPSNEERHIRRRKIIRQLEETN